MLKVFLASLILVAWPQSLLRAAQQTTNAPVAASALFQAATAAYRAGDFDQAARLFRRITAAQPASGTLQNLGNAEWQCGQVGAALLAWEQALWLDPLNRDARNNLRFARRAAQLETPELTWYEVVSSWLPAEWWGWVAGVSLWLSVGAVLLPGIFRFRKATWHQAAAAAGLVVFLLSLPACLGIFTRSHLGFVLVKDTPLRLTPTASSQFVTRMASGEPARLARRRGDFILVRTGRAEGWILENEFGAISTAGPPRQ